MKDTDFGAEVAKILPLIMRAFTRSQQKNIFSKGVLSIPQVVLLDFLDERRSSQMNELARILNFTMSAVTAIVDKMIKLRLIKRERSSRDRRVVNVMMLNKGREAIRRVKEARRNCVSDLFSVLSKEDKEEYIRILRKIYNNLREKE